VKQEYCNKIRSKSANITKDSNSTVDQIWTEIKAVHTEAATEVLGYKRKQKTAPWISKEILGLSDQRKQVKADRNI